MMMDDEIEPEENIGIQSDEDDDGGLALELRSTIYLHRDFEKVVLSVFWRNGKLGAAVFYDETVEIHFLSEVTDPRPNFQMCHHLLNEIKPNTIVISKTITPAFLECIERIVNGMNDEEREPDDTNPNNVHQKIKLEFLSGKHFEYVRSKTRILKMNILDKMKNLLEENRDYYLQSLINFNCKATVSALGALLHFLDTFVAKITLYVPSQHIVELKPLNLESLLYMDRESFNALEIFSANNCATGPIKMRRRNSQKNFCLYNIFNRCSSDMGSRYLRSLMSHPVRDLEKLKRRHEVIEFFLNCENEVLIKNLCNSLKKVHNLNKIILRIVSTEATYKQWKTFRKTLDNALTVGQTCDFLKEKCSLFKEISECLDDSLFIMVQVIDTVIDLEAMAKVGRFVVREGAFPDLDKIKGKFRELDEIMAVVTRLELDDLPDFIQECFVESLPEVGFLLGIPAWSENLSETDLNLSPTMDFKFAIDGVVYYKTSRCAEMDKELGDNYLIIMKHETEIHCEIVEYIQKKFCYVTSILEKIKELDCDTEDSRQDLYWLFPSEEINSFEFNDLKFSLMKYETPKIQDLMALSAVAAQFSMTKPTLLPDEHSITIKNGRHILTQELVEVFVPNDFISSSVDSFVKILTGPNSCGKSVYLKQVALIVYLAHIGSFVPADSAVMGIADSIHTRIQTIESINKELSAFMLDLRQMYSSLYGSNKNSLIIIDEFGKGTADVDGIALLYACLDHFVNRGVNCPHILVATHFHMIPDLLSSSSLVKPQTFEFLFEDENMVHLFRVKNGSSGSSFACRAALGVGFPQKIVDRANQILKIMQSESLEPQPLEDNARTQLQKRRKQFTEKLCSHAGNVTDDVLVDIRRLLENVRF